MYPASAAPKWCILRAGERSWRLAAGEVLDIVPWPRVTRVPGRDRQQLLGVFAWHGTMVPLLAIAELSPDQRRQIVIVRAVSGNGQVPVGIAATQASLGDEAGSADLLALSELLARLPPPRR